MIFFILSGYVITITNKYPLDSFKKILIYLKKRAVRLYPIYLVSILITLVVAASLNHFYNFKTISTHLLFGQVAFVQVMHFNQPLWSLGYEVAYYLFFIVLSGFRWRADFVALAFIAIAICFRFNNNIPPFLTSYLCGASIWLFGVILASQPRNETGFDYGKMLGLLFLFLAYGRMNLGYSVIEKTSIDFTAIQVPSFFERAISFADLTNMVICIPLLCHFTDRRVTGLIWLERAALSMPFFYTMAYLSSGKIHNQQLFNTFIIPFMLYLIAISIYFSSNRWDTIGKKLIMKLIPLGSISYGIYVIHFPLIAMFHSITILSGSGFTFSLRILVYLIIILIIGWFLEKKFHPMVKSYFD